MTKGTDLCPFEVGQYVIYRPSSRGMALDVMTSTARKLIPDNEYRITVIQKGSYIIVDGYEHPLGGIYWTEFAEKKNSQK